MRKNDYGRSAFRRAMFPALALFLQTPETKAAEIGARNGPFVLTDKNLSDLIVNGYEIRTALGNSLLVQKGTSVFSCSFATDAEKLSFKPYFQCAELREEGRLGAEISQNIPPGTSSPAAGQDAAPAPAPGLAPRHSR